LKTIKNVVVLSILILHYNMLN